jgi:hypothetical protein
VKDRNVIRSTPHQYDIGFFGDLDDGKLENGGTETPTDESDDELDAFAPGADISEELEMERISREGMGRVTEAEMDPADAEDLREFLEEESRRREEFGSEGDDEEEEELDEGECESAERYCVEEPPITSTDGSTDEVEDELVSDDHWEDLPSPSADPHSDPQSNEFELDSDAKEDTTFNNANSGSDDELGIWDDQDEGSTVYAIAGDLNSDDLAEGEEVIELPPAPISPPPLSRQRATSRLSVSSLPSRRARSRSQSKPLSKPRKRNMSPPPIHQLHTPPQSTSSATPDTTLVPPIPGPSSAPPLHIVRSKSQPRSMSTSKGKSKSVLEKQVHSDVDAHFSLPSSLPYHKSTPKPKSTPKSKHNQTPTPSKQPKWVPEVVIVSNTPPPKSKPKTRAFSKSLRVNDDGDVFGRDASPKSAIKWKGKGRAMSSPEPAFVGGDENEDNAEESDDPMALVSSSPDQPYLRRTSSTRKISTTEPESEPESQHDPDQYQHRRRYSTPLPVPTPCTPSRGRKRKRVLSSYLEAGGDTGMGLEIPHMISPDIDIIDFSKRSYGAGSSEGRESPVPLSGSKVGMKGGSRGTRRSASSSRAVGRGALFAYTFLLWI